jgi:transaldolase/glucose-6-phosphate isomerase
MLVSCGPAVPAAANPGIGLGVLLGVAARQGRRAVTFALAEPLHPFGPWVEHLLIASTGHSERRLKPVVGEPLGEPERYGGDRLCVAIGLAHRPEEPDARRLAALEAASHPVVQITLGERLELGAEFVRWELAAALLGVNPFDTPAAARS